MLKNIKEFLVITFGTLIVAAAVFFFMLPSHVSVGSGAALAMVLSLFTGCSDTVSEIAGNVADAAIEELEKQGGKKE